MPMAFPRYTVNRCIIILHHKQPFLDWLQSADPHPLENITLADLGNDGDAFMIPGGDIVDGVEDAEKWVEKRWRMFFEYTLGEWLTDESMWPQKLTLKMFREWFDIEYRSMVWDLVDEPILMEDWEEDDLHGEDERLH